MDSTCLQAAVDNLEIILLHFYRYDALTHAWVKKDNCEGYRTTPEEYEENMNLIEDGGYQVW